MDGTAWSDVMVIAIMVGSTMIARMKIAAKSELPDAELKRRCTSGTTIMRPKNPYTTEGIPASRSPAPDAPRRL